MSRLSNAPEENPLTASQIGFAHQLLPFRYLEVVDLSSGKKKLLFAAQEGSEAAYSELHMAAGERTILRLAQDISQLEDALILIDEVETGLHPWVQQLLMLQLQQLALRKNLQIIVTTHSPVILDSVPRYGRIFLDRNEDGNVVVRQPYRDIVQDALYGRSNEKLNLLCEDEIAEGILQGVCEYLSIKQQIKMDSVRIGRDTGASEFPTHAAAFSKFGQIQNFVFILDGDNRNTKIESKIKEKAGIDVPVIFLPGDGAPEMWIWEKLCENPEDYATDLGVNLVNQTSQLNSIYDSASDSPSNKAKFKLQQLGEDLKWNPSDICRTIAKRESGNKKVIFNLCWMSSKMPWKRGAPHNTNMIRTEKP